MKSKQIVVVAAPILALALCLLTPLAAVAGQAKPLAEVVADAAMVSFQPLVAYSQVRVTVSGPGGFEVVADFAAGDVPAIELPGADGLYKYELRFSPVLDRESRELLAAARDSGFDFADAAAAKRTVQSGWFTLANGSLVPDDLVEESDKVVLTNGDGVIRNSLCVGFDCPDSPLFDDSTILFMENNTRLKFGDTSNSPFPNNDWEIEANSNLSGGASYLGFNDCGTADNDGGCATDLVFAVESGARASALYVESDGDVGIGTSNPVLDLHIVTGNTPSLRLDQDGSSGFAPQVWDIAGNEANFFIRDVTSGSLLPFRIRPGAPTSSIDIAVSGDVGIGTASPGGDLDIRGDGSSAFVFNPGTANTNVVNLKNNAGASMFTIFETAGGGAQFSMFDSGANERFRMTTTGSDNRVSGNLGLGCKGATADLTVNSSANAGTTNCGTGTESTMNAGATQFTVTSSRSIKENLDPVTMDGIVEKIASVGVYTYDFIDGPKDRLGLMAEDFHTIFNRGSDKVIDGQEVQMALWLAVQELAADNKELAASNRQLAQKLAELEAQLKGE